MAFEPPPRTTTFDPPPRTVPIPTAPRPEWLGDRNVGTHHALELVLAIPAAERALNRLLAAKDQPTVRKRDRMTLLELQILVAVRRHDRLSVSELSALLEAHEKSVSRALRKLHERGHVQEVPDHADRRRRLQKLTRAGDYALRAFNRELRRDALYGT
jgi:DNA-binding MarR family transcriptional regulator